MDAVSGSLFCQVFLAMGRLLALSWEECALRRFFRLLVRVYRGSLLARVNRAVSDRWKAWWHGSVLVRFFFEKEGILPRSWPGSALCRFLSLLVNLPAAVLHWIYVKLRPWFDGSFFASLAFGMGEQVPIAIGWLMLVVMNIDYSRWSNGYSLLGFAAILLLFVAGGMRRRSLRLDLAGVGLYPVGFFAAVCLSWPLSCYPGLSGRYLPYHITCALCVVLVVSAVERADELERLAVFGCLGMAGAAAYGVYQRFLGIDVDIAYVDLSVNPDMPGRIFSYYQNSNAFSEMLVCLIPVAVGLVIGAKRPVNRFLGFVCAALGGTALIMTYGRASWIGLVVAAVVFLFFWNRKLLPVCIVAGVACLPLLPKSVFQRIMSIFNTSDTSTTSRLPLMEAGLRMIKASPILGAGLGADAARKMAVDIHAYTASYARFTHSHNLFIQLWLEHGLLGITAFLAACWHMIKQGAKAFQSTQASLSTRLITLGAASALAGSLVSGLADYLFTYPRVMLIFWFSVSLLLAGAKLARRAAHSRYGNAL